ncbi:MAG: hypothetical protein FWF33_00610 [Clostridiales bacterium]|nr:hypothetical protein [Clostridiales bacterium]
MNITKQKELLFRQLELLADESETADAEDLQKLTDEMVKIYKAINGAPSVSAVTSAAVIIGLVYLVLRFIFSMSI